MADDSVHNDADDLTCVHVVEIVTEYLEGALPAAEARRLERHLGGCPGCSEYVEQLRAVSGSLGGLSEPSLPRELRDGLIAEFGRLRKD
jgi:anti-sigma factor RsiW